MSRVTVCLLSLCPAFRAHSQVLCCQSLMFWDSHLLVTDLECGNSLPLFVMRRSNGITLRCSSAHRDMTSGWPCLMPGLTSMMSWRVVAEEAKRRWVPSLALRECAECPPAARTAADNQGTSPHGGVAHPMAERGHCHRTLRNARKLPRFATSGAVLNCQTTILPWDMYARSLSQGYLACALFANCVTKTVDFR